MLNKNQLKSPTLWKGLFVPLEVIEVSSAL